MAAVCLAIKLVMLLVAARSALSSLCVLMHNQVLFATGVCSAYFRLFLYRWGLCGVDVTGLVKIFDMMRVELRGLVPSTMPMGA